MRKYKIGNSVFLANGRWEAWVLAYRLVIENSLLRRLLEITISTKQSWRCILMEYKLLGTDSLLKEIACVVVQAADDGRKKLNNDEQEHVIKMTKRMVKEYKRQISEDRKSF